MTGTPIATRAGSQSRNPKSCGGGTSQPTNQESPDARIASQEPKGPAGLATGPQDARPLPIQVHKNLKGDPLIPLPKGPVDDQGWPVMPAFLQRDSGRVGV